MHPLQNHSKNYGSQVARKENPFSTVEKGFYKLQ
jgi:hypothetical protein